MAETTINENLEDLLTPEMLEELSNGLEEGETNE